MKGAKTIWPTIRFSSLKVLAKKKKSSSFAFAANIYLQIFSMLFLCIYLQYTVLVELNIEEIDVTKALI